MSEGQGRCLCGAVKFTAKHISNHVEACHCSMCRRWGGGPLMAVACGTEVAFAGEDNITVYNSSEWAERGFCRQCGTHLFYRLKESKEYQMAAGQFEDQAAFNFQLQVFIDKKPSFYSFANNTKVMTEAEVIEKYGSD